VVRCRPNEAETHPRDVRDVRDAQSAVHTQAVGDTDLAGRSIMVDAQYT
jgi:hypothetical protein